MEPWTPGGRGAKNKPDAGCCTGSMLVGTDWTSRHPCRASLARRANSTKPASRSSGSWSSLLARSSHRSFPSRTDSGTRQAFATSHSGGSATVFHRFPVPCNPCRAALADSRDDCISGRRGIQVSAGARADGFGGGSGGGRYKNIPGNDLLSRPAGRYHRRERLNRRVRDGNGCFPLAMITGKNGARPRGADGAGQTRGKLQKGARQRQLTQPK